MARAATGVVFICFCLLAFFIFQAFQKEQALRAIKAKVRTAAEEVQKKEAEIVQAKLRIQELNAILLPSNTKRDGLLQKRDELSKSIKAVAKDLETCRTQKVQIYHSLWKTVSDAIDAAKEKISTEDQIRQLKHQILDRDKKVCQFVDKNQEEGR
uniref:Si:dkey-87o1.2 n=1 Tax=Scleropages formosus TaxID=113540 RepID=A0A8C9S9J2_SCLFO